MPYLWGVVKEIIKTAIENNQNLIIEGCYIPFGWQDDFEGEYLKHIVYYCLVMTRCYIETQFSSIKKYANVIEERVDDSYCTMQLLIEENEKNLRQCEVYGYPYILIDNTYQVNIEL